MTENQIHLYLSGPMSHIPQFNACGFNVAREALRAKGYVVSCPHERGIEKGMNLCPRGVEGGDLDLADALVWDLNAIIDCDAVAVLDGWEESAGCWCELWVAKMLGKPVYRIDHIASVPAERYREGADPGVVPMTGDERFLRLLRKLHWLHCRKNADYGTKADPLANIRASEEWGVPAWVGAMVRANDKVTRLKAAAQGSALQNEGVEDSLMDLAAYALIALVLRAESDAD